MEPEVSIILLNWNSAADTIECLESLNDITYENYNIIIVDNDSEPESLDTLRKYSRGEIQTSPKFGEYTRSNKPLDIIEISEEEAQTGFRVEEMSDSDFVLIENSENYGFPGGCNIGMKYAMEAGSEYILLLNNDTVVDSDFLSELVNVAEDNDKVGIVGSKILDYEEPDTLQSVGGDIQWWLGGTPKVYGRGEKDFGQYDEIAERDFVWGTSILIGKEVIETISYMDTYFFFGIEEYDYCTTAKENGFKIYYTPASKIWHKKGASSDNLPDYPEILEYYKKQAGPFQIKFYYRLAQKHQPWGLHFVIFGLRLSYMAYRGIVRGINRIS